MSNSNQLRDFKFKRDNPLGLIYNCCCWAEPNLSWDASKQLLTTGSVGSQSMVQLWSCNLYYEDKYYEEDLSESSTMNSREKRDDGRFPNIHLERSIVHLGNMRTGETVGVAWTTTEALVISVDTGGTIRLMNPSDEGLTLRSQVNALSKGMNTAVTAMALSPGRNQIIAISTLAPLQLHSQGPHGDLYLISLYSSQLFLMITNNLKWTMWLA